MSKEKKQEKDPRENVPSKRIKNAYRTFLESKDTTFVSLKAFARDQIKTNGLLKDSADQWFLNKIAR